MKRAWLLPLALLAGCASAPVSGLHLIHEVGPEFPKESRHLQGWVRVRYEVTADGLVTNVAVAASQPPGVFDAAAVRAVSQWRYRPLSQTPGAQATLGVVSTLRFVPPGADPYAGH